MSPSLLYVYCFDRLLNCMLSSTLKHQIPPSDPLRPATRASVFSAASTSCATSLSVCRAYPQMERHRHSPFLQSWKSHLAGSRTGSCIPHWTDSYWSAGLWHVDQHVQTSVHKICFWMPPGSVTFNPEIKHRKKLWKCCWHNIIMEQLSYTKELHR